MGDEIKLDGLKKIIDFLKQKKTINFLVLGAFLFTLFIGVWIRVQNLSLLKDVTTGKYIPMALDPFYFLRLAETIIEQGSLPAVDSMRYLAAQVPYTGEILHYTIVFLYKVFNIFGDYTINYVDIISPVVFFVIGMIVFYFLIYSLTKSKSISVLSSFFLAIIPSYLYRTMTGFSDHEALGMLAFFSVLLIYSLSLNYLEKEKISFRNTILFSLGTALMTSFTIVSWGGGANLIFLIIALSFFLVWILNFKKESSNLNNYLIFYSIWILFSVLFVFLFGAPVTNVAIRYFTAIYGLFGLFVLGFIMVDYFLIKFKPSFVKKDFRIVYSFVLTIILGILGLLLIGKNPYELFTGIINRFFSPFGAARTGLTVAENAQPFLDTWWSQIGKIFFWMFYFGSLIIGFEIAKKFKTKEKITFSFLWILMISGILLSRISANSILNGTNFISKAIYMIGLLLFGVYVIWLYFKKDFRIEGSLILIATWLFFMIVAGRGAVRLFFLVTPIIVVMSIFFFVKLFEYRKNTKDEFTKMIFSILIILSLIGLLISGFNFYKASESQAKYAGPSASVQWQQAMTWVRENTPQDSYFVHWWDYGYWVQYLGERATVTDGGHAVGYWDHLIGRYVLTTPYPETALSFMKSHNVTHLLIDPTEIGKYPAYSKIGSDTEGFDRYSQIPVMISTQNQETENGTIKIYQGGVLIDQDIIYNQNETQVFLPENNAIMGGIILEYSQNNGEVTFKQPIGVFVYNGNQINLPLKYIYFGENYFDFGKGINAGVKVIPSLNQNQQGVNIDNFGAAIYLSGKTINSLLVQLYLLEDPFNKYPTINLKHSEDDAVIASLKSQGAPVTDEFIYYQGFRGPIKIWEIDYPSNIKINEEFLRTSGEYAEFDNLTFTK